LDWSLIEEVPVGIDLLRMNLRHQISSELTGTVTEMIVVSSWPELQKELIRVI
jgi:hypothetical protein